VVNIPVRVGQEWGGRGGPDSKNCGSKAHLGKKRICLEELKVWEKGRGKGDRVSFQYPVNVG